MIVVCFQYYVGLLTILKLINCTIQFINLIIIDIDRWYLEDNLSIFLS